MRHIRRSDCDTPDEIAKLFQGFEERVSALEAVQVAPAETTKKPKKKGKKNE